MSIRHVTYKIRNLTEFLLEGRRSVWPSPSTCTCLLSLTSGLWPTSHRQLMAWISSTACDLPLISGLWPASHKELVVCLSPVTCVQCLDINSCTTMSVLKKIYLYVSSENLQVTWEDELWKTSKCAAERWGIGEGGSHTSEIFLNVQVKAFLEVLFTRSGRRKSYWGIQGMETEDLCPKSR